MIQGLILKTVISVVMEKVAEKHKIKKLRDYVEKDNELDIQVRQLNKTIAKQGKYIEELEKDVAILKSNSHPPVFKESSHKNILKRLRKLENAK